jgi:hypothetical protein
VRSTAAAAGPGYASAYRNADTPCAGAPKTQTSIGGASKWSDRQHRSVRRHPPMFGPGSMTTSCQLRWKNRVSVRRSVFIIRSRLAGSTRYGRKIGMRAASLMESTARALVGGDEDPGCGRAWAFHEPMPTESATQASGSIWSREPQAPWRKSYRKVFVRSFDPLRKNCDLAVICICILASSTGSPSPCGSTGIATGRNSDRPEVRGRSHPADHRGDDSVGRSNRDFCLLRAHAPR